MSTPPIGTVEFDDNGILFSTRYHPPLIEDVRSVVGAHFDPKGRTWTLPLSADAISAAIIISNRYKLDGRERLMSGVQALQNKRRHLLSLSHAIEYPDKFPVPGLQGALRPHQYVALEYVRRTKKLILGDDMGTGKTLVCLSSMAIFHAYPALVVCPATMRLPWRQEIRTFFPSLKAVIVGLGGPEKRDREISAAKQAHIIICNYELLNKIGPALTGLPFRMIVADEAHYVKDATSQRGQALKNISRGRPYIVLATGTPLINAPKDLIAPLAILDRLDQFGGWEEFVRTYCDGHENKYGWNVDGASNLLQLQKEMRSSCFIRRTKDQLNLPPKIRTAVPVAISNLHDYLLAERSLVEWLQKNHSGKDANTRIQSSERAWCLSQISALRSLVGAGKIAASCEYIQAILDSGNKVVVFAVHVAVQKKLASLFPGFLTILGDDPPNKRQESIARFQSKDGPMGIICSQKAGGIGITLTQASHEVFVEYDWTFSSHEQAEDRVCRIGQTKTVNIWNMHAPNTIDDDMKFVVDKKCAITDHAVNNYEALNNYYGDDLQILLSSFTKRYF